MPAAALVRELGALVEDVHALDLGAGDEEELLVRIRSQLLGAFVQKQGTDGVAPRLIRLPRVFLDDPVKTFKKFVRPPDLRRDARGALSGAHSFAEPADQLFALLNQCLFLFVDMRSLHVSYASVISLSMVNDARAHVLWAAAPCAQRTNRLPRGAKQVQWLWLRISAMDYKERNRVAGPLFFDPALECSVGRLIRSRVVFRRGVQPRSRQYGISRRRTEMEGACPRTTREKSSRMELGAGREPSSLTRIR